MPRTLKHGLGAHIVNTASMPGLLPPWSRAAALR